MGEVAHRLRKVASATMAPTSPLPQVSITPTPAPGKRGPVGTSPRNNTSRVNTEIPMPSPVGQEAKAIPPSSAAMLPQRSALPPPPVPQVPQVAAQTEKVSEVYMGSSIARPTVQDMIKAAMAGTVSRAHLAQEGHRQAAHLGEKTASEAMCEKCEKSPCTCKKKMASYAQTMHLADAVEFLADEFAKQAQMVGEGESALHVTESRGGAPMKHETGKATAQSGMQSGSKGSASQLMNTLDHRAGGAQHQGSALSGGSKTAASAGRVADTFEVLGKGVRHTANAVGGTAKFVKNRAVDVKNIPSNLKSWNTSQNIKKPLIKKIETIGENLRANGKKVPGKVRDSMTDDYMSAVNDLKSSRAERVKTLGAVGRGLGTVGVAGTGVALGVRKALKKKKEDKESKEASEARSSGPGTRRLSTGESAASLLLGGPSGYLGAAKARNHGHSALEGHFRGIIGAGLGGAAGGLIGRAAGAALGQPQVGSLVGHLAGTIGGYKATTHAVGQEKKHASVAAIIREKLAEDAINPAHITAGSEVPPDTSESGESGGAPVGGPPEGATRLIGSNEAATNYTKHQAKAAPKADMRHYTSEPALNDHVLQNAFAHSGEAGVKMGSAGSVKTAAARALLAKLVEASAQA